MVSFPTTVRSTKPPRSRTAWPYRSPVVTRAATAWRPRAGRRASRPGGRRHGVGTPTPPDCIQGRVRGAARLDGNHAGVCQLAIGAGHGRCRRLLAEGEVAHRRQERPRREIAADDPFGETGGDIVVAGHESAGGLGRGGPRATLPRRVRRRA